MLVNIPKYIGFCLYHRFYLVWSLVNSGPGCLLYWYTSTFEIAWHRWDCRIPGSTDASTPPLNNTPLYKSTPGVVLFLVVFRPFIYHRGYYHTPFARTTEKKTTTKYHTRRTLVVLTHITHAPVSDTYRYQPESELIIFFLFYR